MDFAAQGYTWTKSLCVLDSDGDGKSNGCELGDPFCTWVVGQRPNFISEISHPGSRSSVTNRTSECGTSRIYRPITPHSGWISLSAVFVPLVLAALVGSIITNIASVRKSATGISLLHERDMKTICPRVCSSCTNRFSFISPRSVDVSTREADQNGSNAQNVPSCRFKEHGYCSVAVQFIRWRISISFSCRYGTFSTGIVEARAEA